MRIVYGADRYKTFWGMIIVLIAALSPVSISQHLKIFVFVREVNLPGRPQKA